MTVDSHSPDGLAIRKLTPISTLSSAHFDAICAQTSIENQGPGHVLFKRGDTDKEFIYLLEGEVSLQSEEFSIETVSAREEPVRFPLAHQIPRKIDAVAVSPIRFCRVSVENIKAPPEIYYKYEEEDSGYMVSNETETQSGDWMSALLSSPVFLRLPPANLQKVLLSFEPVEYKSGDAIIRQGDEGDYFYFIREGSCLLTRKPAPDAKEIKLAQLRQFDSFGEDALISGKTREASATALTDMVVLRMNKDKFNTLIKGPIMNYIDFSEAQKHLQQQTGLLLDMRDPDAYNALHVGGSQNMPFFSLRMQLKALDREKKLILLCQDGKLSEAAAFLLIKSGFAASIVKGGIDKVPQDALIGSQAASAQQNAGMLSGGEFTPSEQPAGAAAEIPGSAAQLASLKAENEELKASLELLQQQYQFLMSDKKKLEKNFRLLMAQAEKLKDMLRKLHTQGPKQP